MSESHDPDVLFIIILSPNNNTRGDFSDIAHHINFIDSSCKWMFTVEFISYIQ